MYINQIDELFDNILNRLYEYLVKNKTLQKYYKDNNFVIFQNDILKTIKDFITQTVSKKEIIDIVKHESYYDFILGTIKRYCAFYIYLGIAYYYNGDRGLFITNIIETSKNIKDSTFNISNFYNKKNFYLKKLKKYTHIHTYTHTYIHTYTHTYTHTYILRKP